MKILTPITIDFIDPHPLPVMKVQQGNIGRGALVTLTANGAIAALTDETVRTYVKKPDGTKVYAAGRVTADGKAQIEFTNQMLAVPGRVELELELINDTDYITTPIAILEVGRSNIDDAAIESSNEFSAFVTALAQIGPAAAGKLGTVKPDGTTITADTDGTIHAADQDVSGKAVAFAAATSRTNLATGDTVATGFGKIAKWFADLGTAAFKGVSNVLSQTAEGYVLDARQGKILADRIGDLAALATTEKGSLVGALNEQNSNLSGLAGSRHIIPIVDIPSILDFIVGKSNGIYLVYTQRCTDSPVPGTVSFTIINKAGADYVFMYNFAGNKIHYATTNSSSTTIDWTDL